MTMPDAWGAGLLLFALWFIFAARAGWTAYDNPRIGGYWGAGATVCFVAAVVVIVGGGPS